MLCNGTMHILKFRGQITVCIGTLPFSLCLATEVRKQASLSSILWWLVNIKIKQTIFIDTSHSKKFPDTICLHHKSAKVYNDLSCKLDVLNIFCVHVCALVKYKAKRGQKLKFELSFLDFFLQLSKH